MILSTAIRVTILYKVYLRLEKTILKLNSGNLNYHCFLYSNMFLYKCHNSLNCYIMRNTLKDTGRA